MTFAIQHRGILGTANVQKYIGLLVIIPMLIVGVVPILTGQINWANYSPLVPLAAAYAPEPGAWNIAGWTLVLGGMFIAAWSTYGFETAVCYTSEFKNPGTDTFKAIFYSGLLCLLLFILVPFTFQGVLGLNGMLATPIVDGSGVAEAMGRMVGGGGFITNLMVMLMILALLLSIMTAMAGSSRTLYQGSVDGWLPRYLEPRQRAWRADAGDVDRPRLQPDRPGHRVVPTRRASSSSSPCRTAATSSSTSSTSIPAGSTASTTATSRGRGGRRPGCSALGAIFAFVNAVFMGAGAKVWNPMALWAGLFTAALIIPVFWFRHYVQDSGRFPEHMLDDLGMKPSDLASARRECCPT